MDHNLLQKVSQHWGEKTNTHEKYAGTATINLEFKENQIYKLKYISLLTLIIYREWITCCYAVIKQSHWNVSGLKKNLPCELNAACVM